MADDNKEKPWAITGHIMEIKVMLAETKTTVKAMQTDLREHAEKDAKRSAQIEKIRSELDQAKGSLKMLKWFAPAGPAIVVLIMKLMGKL